MIKFSIIIPVYNSKNYLPRLIDSVLNQKYSNYEMVFVDDGSTDDSLLILKDYQKKCSKIKIISTSNNGPGIARKIGFEKCTGDLLFFVDSDDALYDENVLSSINKIYTDFNFDILFFNTKLLFDNEEKIINGLYDDGIVSGLYDIKLFKNKKIGPALWYKIFRKDKMKTEYFVDSNNFEDCYTTFNYLNACNNMYITNEIYYVSDRTNEGSISKENSILKIMKTVNVLKETYSQTHFKNSIIYTIVDYYLFARRSIDKWNISKCEKENVKSKLKELKLILKKHKIMKLKISLKDKIKYIYYSVKDLKNGK